MTVQWTDELTFPVKCEKQTNKAKRLVVGIKYKQA